LYSTAYKSETFCFSAARTIQDNHLSATEILNKLWLSGSRGVGGIASVSDGITSLELLDLEEDEFDDDEEEGDEFEE